MTVVWCWYRLFFKGVLSWPTENASEYSVNKEGIANNLLGGSGEEESQEICRSHRRPWEGTGERLGDGREKTAVGCLLDFGEGLDAYILHRIVRVREAIKSTVRDAVA